MRCPECGKFDIEYDPNLRTERCLWRDCGFVNREHLDLEKLADNYFRLHGTKYKKFAKSLKPLKNILDT